MRTTRRSGGASSNVDPAIAANVIIGLIKVANYLLDRQIRQLERAFIEEGGLRERMTQARLTHRARQQRGVAKHVSVRKPPNRGTE